MLETGWVIVSYLLGSIPFGLILARIFCKTDPQKAGSGNIGATNVTRLCGLPVGIATLVCDAGKGVLAIKVALYIMVGNEWSLGQESLFITCVGLAVLLGHMYSIFLRFHGGKAVATTIGVFATLALPQTLLAAALCVGVICWKKYVSLGSLVFVLSLPIIIFVSGRLELLVLSGTAALMVANAHRGNIKRLIAGEEKPWRTPKDKKQD